MFQLRKIICALVTLSVCFEVSGQNDLCGTAPKVCAHTQVRSYDGSCNNLKNPKWGSVGSEYGRLLPPKYGDGLSSLPKAVSGKHLPNPRKISLEMYPDDPIEDEKFTLNIVHYGQIVAHDISDTFISPSNLGCCTPDFQFLNSSQKSKSCLPIKLSIDDLDYSQINGKCMSFRMTDTNQMHGCSKFKQFSEKINRVSSFLDLHMIYGTSDKTNGDLRTFKGGFLQHEFIQNQEWCKRSNKPKLDCFSDTQICYDTSGDPRINQNPDLSLLHVILLREHNRIAKELSKLNPRWNDEKLFQEARKINIAQHQHITYYELLPIYMGRSTLIENQLIYENRGIINDYNENINPQAFNEFSQAAFRYFHTLVWGRLDLYSEDRDFLGSILMKDWYNNPAVLEMNDNFDMLARGVVTQTTFAADVNHDPEISKFFFKQPHMKLGLDLKSLDIQRSRNHGLPSYNDMRQFCGLRKAKHFNDFLDVIESVNVNKLKNLYEDPNDIDLTVGGSLEKLVPGTLIGPTFLCILVKQFLTLRISDRLFYENGNLGFTLEQLNEIRKMSVSKLICNNGKNITTMQPQGFRTISERNKLVPCGSLPSIDLRLWRKT